PWPVISQFLSSLPAGSIGLDSGTGNGKYLPLPVERPGSVWTIGMDRSGELLKLARYAGSSSASGSVLRREVVLGDALDVCWREGAFDYAISIATIHHLSTPERRRRAIKALLRSVSPSHGRVLIYVWAVDQDELSKRTIPETSTSDSSASKGRDALVPWVLSEQPGKKSEPSGSAKVYQRYYHFFESGELKELTCEAATELGLQIGPPPQDGEGNTRGVEIVQDSWERSNFYIELKLWEV
ncbi:hypothetical protein SISSUDRAFT_990514, partial [Sistotremastrum suecicum HHB10207 ss-3]